LWSAQTLQQNPCTKIAAELAETRGVRKSHLAEAFARLESVGAISRVKRGRARVIAMIPKGAFRGDLSYHGEAIARYSADVAKLCPETTG